MSTEHSLVSVSASVPDARPENTTVTWDEECNLLCIRVDRGLPDSAWDWYVEIPLPVEADGAKCDCILEGSTLRVRAPITDTPTGTGLFLQALFEKDTYPCVLA